MPRIFALSILSAAAFLTSCAATPPDGQPAPPPAQPAQIYRALGTEPFWSLTLDGREMVFTQANAPGVRVVQPQPRPIFGFAGEIYRSPRINVNIVHGKCSDGMSDRTYSDSVQLGVDGRSFEGCGGEPIKP